MNSNKLNMENVLAKKRQHNNRLFDQHRKDVLPKVEAMKSQRNKAPSQSVDATLSARINQARSLIKTGLDRSYRILDTVKSHSEQLKQEDVIQKYIEIEQISLEKIAAFQQHHQQLDSIVADLHARIDQIISDIAGLDESESGEFTKPDAAAHSVPTEKSVKTSPSKTDKTQAFEKGLAAKAAGMGFPPEAIAKAMKK
ncbi:MAG: hypothetical protein DRP56_00690 [Planctomycetota bacterium]|nr:MAG: hypothetical protein DRP56_00690 [Planctomycetota bacterium]